MIDLILVVALFFLAIGSLHTNLALLDYTTFTAILLCMYVRMYVELSTHLC